MAHISQNAVILWWLLEKRGLEARVHYVGRGRQDQTNFRVRPCSERSVQRNRRLTNRRF